MSIFFVFWPSFCFCKIEGDKLKCQLGNCHFRIQQVQIMLKSQVPNFYPKMPLMIYLGPFSQNPPSLYQWLTHKDCIHKLLNMLTLWSGVF